eukprot:COSAG02_NODE_6321_length_3652_cov_2.413453_2_plen_212_part_00
MCAQKRAFLPEQGSLVGRMAASEQQQSPLGETPRRLPPMLSTSQAPEGSGSEGGVDRERLLNDILNTGVMGALIGGFALSNVQQKYDMGVTLDLGIYMCSFVAVHACTCSAVCAALLYRVANALSDRETPRWAAKNAALLKLPMMKFAFGCLTYLLSVVLISWRDLEAVEGWQIAALIIGVMSMSMTLGIAIVLGRQNPVDINQLARKSDD